MTGTTKDILWRVKTGYIAEMLTGRLSITANISPQIGVFNQKYWAALEKQVQTWGRSTQQSVYDKVYVTKGGTINKLLTNFTGGH